MAKYIIDIEDEYTKDWINDTPMCKELCMPISVPNRQKTYHVPMGFKLEPYTEPDREAIEDEVWKFAKKIGSFNGLTKHELDECFGHTTIQGVMTTYDTYQEAKDKYDAWKKQREKINIGDEISCPGKLYVEAVVIGMDDDDDLYIIWKQSGKIDMIESSQRKHWVKTGICFHEVEELLKKMREEFNED